jgi:hypothetical protein
MFYSLYSQIALISLVLCCGFAIWKGGAPERLGAILIAASWAVTLVAAAVTRSYMPATAFLVSDGVMAVGLLILAVRYSSLWMGAAMLVQAIVLSLHGGYFAAERSELSRHWLHLYVLGKNLGSGALLLILLSATVTSVLGRRMARDRKTAKSQQGARWVGPVAKAPLGPNSSKA